MKDYRELLKKQLEKDLDKVRKSKNKDGQAEMAAVYIQLYQNGVKNITQIEKIAKKAHRDMDKNAIKACENILKYNKEYII